MDIKVIIILILLAVIGGVLNGKGKRRFKYNPNEEWPFQSKNLLTEVEQSLYFKLRDALPGLCIFSQVQLSQIVSVKKGHDFKQWFNRISRMSADFVITDKSSQIVAVIELDDSSHNRPDRIEADRKKIRC